ncbi:MAG TPA: YkgJ family cysteine cluster protein [Spirochaetia bacterium]|nr:YkgJ family cysteine cluster protein [Spirochaetia bacterium]
MPYYFLANKFDRMKADFWNEGLQFTCQRCSRCCRHDPGVVFLSAFEIITIARHLSCSVKAFLNQYCRPIYNASGYRVSLQEKQNFDCIFWESGTGCSIYTVRPIQCSTFPFWETLLRNKIIWDEEAKYCPGINKGILHDASHIQKCLDERNQYPILQFSYSVLWETLDENSILGN